MADIGILDNERSIDFTSTGGHLISVFVPVVALAFGWCKVVFDGDVYAAGNTFRLTSGDNSIDVTLDDYGNGEASLYPFIRAYMAQQKAQDLPLETDALEEVMDSAEHNYFTLAIKDMATGTEQSVVIYFIYGTNVLQAASDKYINFNTGDTLGTWQTLEYFADNDQYGVPTDADAWRECNYNLNIHLDTPSDVEQLEVTTYRGDKIVNGVVNYHLIPDCRIKNVRAVKWLDSRGGINIRKLTFAGENHSSVRTDSYQRPHTDLNIPNGDYYHGDDKWENIVPATTINLGDDAIPMELFDWLKELVTSPVVEYWDGEVNGAGKWLRCNVTDTTIERDPRKNTFSLSLSLALPSYAVQQF